MQSLAVKSEKIKTEKSKVRRIFRPIDLHGFVGEGKNEIEKQAKFGTLKGLLNIKFTPSKAIDLCEPKC